MSNIERSHIHFLRQKFFKLIQKISFDRFTDIYFEKSIDVLDKQINEDKIEIQIFFNRFRADWNKKERVIEKKYEEAAMKGTNYVMKEVQKIREIEVIVANDGDIDTEIEPYF